MRNWCIQPRDVQVQSFIQNRHTRCDEEIRECTLDSGTWWQPRGQDSNAYCRGHERSPAEIRESTKAAEHECGERRSCGSSQADEAETQASDNRPTHLSVLQKTDQAIHHSDREDEAMC